MVEVATRGGRRNWPALKRGVFDAILRQVRAGHAGGEANLAAYIGNGVRFLLGRQAGGRAPERLVEAALAAICQEVRLGRIDSPAGVVRLLRRFGEGTMRAGGSRASAAPGAGPISQVIPKLDEREREALRRHYVHGESLEEILSDLGIPIDSFLDLKARLRREGQRREAAERPATARAAASG
jgi:hypothetical protein